MVALDDKNDDYSGETVIRNSPFTSGFQIPGLMGKTSLFDDWGLQIRTESSINLLRR